MEEATTARKITPSATVSHASEATVSSVETARTIVDVDWLDFHFIGPSGCGKSTLLRCFNRMNDLIDHAKITAGEIRIDGANIHGPNVDVIKLRKRVGMVFQKSNPFPKSIYENIAYGVRIAGVRDRHIIDEAVEDSLTRAASGMKSKMGCAGARLAFLEVNSSVCV